jgi:signal transduction histidine kinase
MDTQERKILYYLLLGAATLAALLFVFLRNLVKHYKHSQRLHQQLAIAELTTLENERKRIHADLHDEMGPLLSTTKLLISNIAIHDNRSASIATKAMNNTDVLLKKIRQIAFDIMPSALRRKGLLPAVEEYIDELRLCTMIRWHLNYDDRVSVAPDAELQCITLSNMRMRAYA